MNVLVTGANGQLGMSIRELAGGYRDRFIFTDVNSVPGLETVYLDITNPDAVRIICDSEQVDVIVNCAGYTAVDAAEDDFQMADLLNHQAPGILGGIARERDAALIHISTDFVFDGRAGLPYPDDAPLSPLSVYGSTKAAGERVVASSLCRHIIFRTAWLYSIYGRNFAKTMLNLFKERPLVKVVYDQIGSPTYAPDLASAILKVISSGDVVRHQGIFNYSSQGAVSWYDFAKAIHRLSGLKMCDVEPCLSAEFPQKAERPRYSVLDKTLVAKTFGVHVPYWEDSLERFFTDGRAAGII